MDEKRKQHISKMLKMVEEEMNKIEFANEKQNRQRWRYLKRIQKWAKGKLGL